MTRDEAIEKVDGLEPFDLPTRRGQNELLVDKLVALGMLKLDEPKSEAEEKFRDVYRKWPHGWTASACLADLNAAGLKIVEK